MNICPESPSGTKGIGTESARHDAALQTRAMPSQDEARRFRQLAAKSDPPDPAQPSRPEMPPEEAGGHPRAGQGGKPEPEVLAEQWPQGRPRQGAQRAPDQGPDRQSGQAGDPQPGSRFSEPGSSPAPASTGLMSSTASLSDQPAQGQPLSGSNGKGPSLFSGPDGHPGPAPDARARDETRPGPALPDEEPAPASPTQAANALPNPESILPGLRSPGWSADQAGPTGQAEGAGQAGADNAAASRLESAAAAIAQRILVSDRTADQGMEVRIQLKEDVLPGTEIRVARDAHGLSISLVTANEQSHAFLRANQDGLLQHLQDRIKEPVQVQARLEGQPTGQDHNQGRDQGRDQGRSRQQRSVYEEYEA